MIMNGKGSVQCLQIIIFCVIHQTFSFVSLLSFRYHILICQFILIFLNLFMLGISVQFPDEFLKWLNTLLNTLLWNGHLAGAFSAFVTFAETSAGIKKSVHLHGKYPTVGSELVMSSCH